MASHSSWSLGPLIAAAAAALVLVNAPVVAQDQLPGVDAVKLLEARYDHTATLVDDGYIVIAGGSAGTEALASVEEVDPLGTSVATLGSLAVARTGHTATRLPDGRILIAGGQGAGATLADAELFDPLSGETRPTAPMRHPRAQHLAVALPDGRALVVGGIDGDAAVAEAEIFDPTSETFLEAAAPDISSIAAATLLPDGRVFVTRAGAPAAAAEADKAKSKKKAKDEKAKDEKAKDKKAKDKKAGNKQPKSKPIWAQVYDPATDAWRSLKGSVASADREAIAMPDGRVLLAGGADATALLVEPATGAVVQTGAMSGPRTDFTATLLPDGRALLAGGTYEGRGVSALEVFDPTDGESEHAGDLLIPRTGHSVTVLPGERLLIIGGRFADLALDDILVFDPPTATLQALNLDMDVAADPVGDPDPRTSADIRTEYGPPEAFAIYYFDEIAADGTTVPSSIQTWGYPSRGVGFTFDADRVVAEDVIEIGPPSGLVVAPYDPDQFRAYMSVAELIHATGIDEYLGGPADEVIEGGELFFAPQLACGLQDGELRSVEAFATEAAPVDTE